MNTEKNAHLFATTVEELSDFADAEEKGFFHEHSYRDPIPSSKVLEEIVELCRTIFFPGYFGKNSIDYRTLKYEMGICVEELRQQLIQQVVAGLCFTGEGHQQGATREIYEKAEAIVTCLIKMLPQLRQTLETDVIAAYNGDPAATDIAEVITCYPAIKVLINYRVAHELYKMAVPLIPRMLTEMAHSETGIDIHPGAEIGHHFTIDHGTGVVIGATTIIGNHVKLYQGVTLGAKSFALDEKGNPIKGIPRHPILEDDVIIYSNATILGRVTIGQGAIIGGNIWITEDVPAGAKIVQYRKQQGVRSKKCIQEDTD